MGLFHHNDTAASTNAAGYNDPAVGSANTGGHVRHDAEGAAAGGFAGHEYEKHHAGTGGPGTKTGLAAGAFGGHEYNKHEAKKAARAEDAAYANDTAYNNNNNNNTRTMGTGATAGTGAGLGAGTGAGYNSASTTAGGNYPSTGAATSGNQVSGVAGDPATNHQARSLQRSGKMETTLGKVLCSTTLQQKGLQKQAQGESLIVQSQQIAEAENLEAEARMRRAHAEGLSQHPNNVLGGTGAGMGPGAGTGMGAGTGHY